MKTTVDLDSLPTVDNPGRIAILQSKWYPEIVQSMTDACVRTLNGAGFSQVEVHTVPGSLELPIAAADLCATDRDKSLDAIICFGVIVKGETLHFEMIAEECMRGLGDTMRVYRVPIVVEVLPVFDIQHARDRAADDEFNKGIEAAVAAVEMAAWRRSIGAR